MGAYLVECLIRRLVLVEGVQDADQAVAAAEEEFPSADVCKVEEDLCNADQASLRYARVVADRSVMVAP